MSIFITGANRGIGNSMACAYANAGKSVVGTTRGSIPSESHPSISWQALDVTKQKSFDALNEAIQGTPIALLICNAGVYLDRDENLAEGFAPDIWDQTFKANVLGPFLTIQNLLPNLQAANSAKIAIMGSWMGSNARPHGGSYAYRASKAAVINLASNLATDLKHIGIAVGVYHPGWVRTDMGGPDGDIGLEEATSGLIQRFEALSMETTGCFESYDGSFSGY